MDGVLGMDVAHRRHRRSQILYAVGVAVALAGCQSPEQKLQPAESAAKPGSRAEVQEPIRVEPKKSAYISPRQTIIGSSVEGRSIEGLEFGAGEDVVLILASIHGNESAGTPLVRKLARYIVDRPDLVQGRRLVIVPAANPDGLAKGTRNNVRGVDLNRNFPATNYQIASNHGSAALSEPESKALQQLLATCKPDRIVSLHQPANHGPACIDFDGPAEGLARAMAAQCDLPVQRLGGRNGSLGSYAGITLGIPIITVEMPKAASGMNADALWAKYGKMLLAAVCYPGPVRGDIRTDRATSVAP